MTNATSPSLDRKAYVAAVHAACRELTGWRVHVELGGCVVGANLTYCDGGPGLRAAWEVDTLSDPILVDRAEWDVWCPGVEPTAAAMRRFFEVVEWDRVQQDALRAYERGRR